MSLSTQEQQALDSIEDGLAGSDPRLASLLTIFTRLTSGEAMPAREKLRTRGWRATARPRRSSQHAGQGKVCRQMLRAHRWLGWQLAMPVLWLTTVIALIAVGVILSGSGHGACARSWPVACAPHACRRSVSFPGPRRGDCAPGAGGLGVAGRLIQPAPALAGWGGADQGSR